eukprot:gb/GECG01006575.1/.p1 GENE.gb/GECG01006575.1/~~gb/GECG01006575.1/.p1  ORF type:complete len:153 (+),score=8.48 gb/GECG01006575.1/:1-459(+)
MWSTPRPVGYLKADRDVPNPNVRFWMGRSKEDVLHWYQGQLGRYETMEENQRIFCRMADQLENVIKRSLSEFNRQHETTRQVLWDRQRMREFERGGRKVRPLVTERYSAEIGKLSQWVGRRSHCWSYTVGAKSTQKEERTWALWLLHVLMIK